MRTTKHHLANHLCFALAILLTFEVFAIGPRERVHPNRPNPPGPNNPIGPNNPAVSNPLSSLNPMAPFSTNQIMLRQLLQNLSKNNSNNSSNLMPTNSISYPMNASFNSKKNQQSIPANYELLLKNRTSYSTSHPIIFERPDPLIPLSNYFAVINNRYYQISQDPANDSTIFLNSNTVGVKRDVGIYSLPISTSRNTGNLSINNPELRTGKYFLE